MPVHDLDKDLHVSAVNEQEDESKLGLLQPAVEQGFLALERDNFVALGSTEEISAFLKDIHTEISNDLAAGPNVG